jgi:GTPase SAR1 family protein
MISSTMNTVSNGEQYQQFQEKRNVLINLLERQLQVIHDLNMTGREDILHRLIERVRDDNFKVLILGEFKRGKSTFINAMLGDEILPAYARPCTAIINEVKWGESPTALLHPASTEEDTIPPKEVSVKDLESYVTIQEGMGESAAIRENLYDKVELFWPLELCQNGVEIIDSPGLNEHDIRQKVTMDYLSTVDAILFVLSCEALGSQSELDVIDNTLLAMGHEDIFFICNRFNMIRPKEREEIRRHGLAKLANRTKQGEKRVFFIDALGALDGRLAGDLDAVEKTNVPALERELATFLATDRGRVKILRPAMELRSAIKEAYRIIPERQGMLRTDAQTLEKRYEEAKVPLSQLETKRQQLVTQMVNLRKDTEMLVSDRTIEFYREMTEKVANWAEAYELQNPVKIPTKGQIEQALQEIIQHLSQKLEGEFSQWQQSTLQPLVQERLESRRQELDEKAAEFLEQLDGLRVQIAGVSIAPTSSSSDERTISPLERVLSAAGGLLIGGVGSAGIGAVFGYQEMLKSLIPQIVLGALGIAIAGFNPWVLIPLLAVGGGVEGLLVSQGINRKLKTNVAQKYATEIRASAHTQATKVASAIAAELKKIEDAVNSGLGKEIQGVSDQVSSVLKEKQNGQANVDQKLKELDEIMQSLTVIDGELDDLITQMMLPQ